MKGTKIGIYFILLQILCFKFINGWDQIFQYIPCYEAKMDERMSLSIDNLIAIIEGYERENFNTAPETIADALLNRYRTNGIVFQPDSTLSDWAALQYEESFKQNLDDKLLKPSAVVPEDTFQPREECSIHLSLSHSVDYYPHDGVDYIWENNYFTRRKRSTYPNVPDNVDPAEHPVEFGVIQTSAGPVSGGLLIAGIKASAITRSYTVGDLIGASDDSKLPKDMLSKTIESFYGATISGVLAKAAILTKDKEFEVGPIGMFGNCSACPRLYSLENNNIYYLTRAELFGAMDGFNIGLFLRTKSSSQSMTLSEVLRMYYGSHGLLNSDLRACNRMEIYKKYKSDLISTIKEQALNYMYAFQNYFPNVANPVLLQSDDITMIEKAFQQQLSKVYTGVNSFLSSYSYDDPGYYSCSVIIDDYKYETEVDLVVIYSPIGSSSDIDSQLEYISLTARRVGVGYHRSRIAVFNGKTKDWLSPMTNYSNIADYVCNYTTSASYSTANTQNFIEILDDLSTFYDTYFSNLRSNPDISGKNSQVVLWNLPNSFEGEEDAMLREWDKFNLTYPDVTFIFVGSRSSETLSFLGDEILDLILITPSSSLNPIDISTDIVNEIVKAPRLFYYPECDTESNDFSKERDHVYTMYVSPNFSTIIKIPPQAFHFSEDLKLNIQGNDLRVCVSRVNLQPTENDPTEETDCEDSPYEFDFKFLCGRYVNECSPIYISVTGDSAAKSFCSDDYCIYPDQIEFEMSHEGMVCSGYKPFPALLLIIFVFLMAIEL